MSEKSEEKGNYSFSMSKMLSLNKTVKPQKLRN